MSGQSQGPREAALFCGGSVARPTESGEGSAPPVVGDAAAAGSIQPQLANMANDEAEQLYRRVVDAIKQIYDPEIPVNIYDLGLIYDVCIYPLGRVAVHMTLTSPACPVAGSLPPEVERTVEALEGVTAATVELVWDPPWAVEMMSEDARLELNLL